MAIDTEAKRWSMMQHASGATYAMLLNPETSGLVAIERATVLRHYGGIAWQGPAASAVLSGTIIGANEDDIVAGGKTVLLTLTNDTWETAPAFDLIRGAIRNGLDSAQSEVTGWNAEVRDKQPLTTVVRTSDTVVTITLVASGDYDITADETITATIPAVSLAGTSEIIAAPTFDVTFVADEVVQPPTAGGGGGGGGTDKRRRPPFTGEGFFDQFEPFEEPAPEVETEAATEPPIPVTAVDAVERGSIADVPTGRVVDLSERRAATRRETEARLARQAEEQRQRDARRLLEFLEADSERQRLAILAEDDEILIAYLAWENEVRAAIVEHLRARQRRGQPNLAPVVQRALSAAVKAASGG